MNIAAHMMTVLYAMAQNPSLYKASSEEKLPLPVLVPCDPSRHGCLRYDQIEKTRKTTRRANRAAGKRYRRKT